MINVSNEFKQLMNKRTNFKENAIITFSNGTVLELKENDFTVSNNGIVDASGTSGIPLGVAVCKSIQIELMNDDERFSEYDFFGATIRLFLTFELSETVERIERGTFTVLTPETYGTTVIITALDDMYKADKDYETELVFPATTQSILVDACNLLDISLGTTTFLNDDFIVKEKPTDITFRQLIGYISMIAGGNARIDNTGRLQIISYDFEQLESIYSVIDGGNYFKWNNENTIDGGTFGDSNTTKFIDGGQFGDRKDYHVLGNWKNLKVDTDDVIITGISTSYTDEDNEEHSVIYGVDGYVLNVENPLIIGQEESSINLIGNVMVGGRFRQFSGDLISNPTIEFMDPALIIDRKGNVYTSFVTDIDFQFFGFTTLSNSAEPTIRNSAKAYSQATQTLVTARKLIKNERTAREQALEQLAKDLQNSSGLFMTKEEQEDKSIIYYMHDKPNLSESMVIWKLTALAFAISTDGGKTYPYGFSVDGTTITRLLYAEGIDADYIDTGAIRITDTDGNTMFLADYDTKNVYINADNVFIGSESVSSNNEKLSSSITQNAESITAEVKRAQGQEVELAASIKINSDNILLKVSKGNISSEISQESGKISIKSNRFSLESTNCTITESGKITAKDVDLSGKITATSGEIGGFTIGTTSIYSGKSSLSSSLNGVYIGTDGISVGGYGSSPAFKVDSDGDISITGDIAINSINGELVVGSGVNAISISGNGVKFGSSTITASVTKDKLSVYNNYIDEDRIRAFSGSTAYTEMTWQEIKAYSSTSSYCTLKSDELAFASSDTFNILSGTTNLVSLYKGHCTYGGDVATLGKSSGSISFFGSATGSTKQTVSTITTPSTASASTIATKVNDVINALKKYNLL